MPYEQSAEEKVRAEYEMRQKAWRDRASQMEEAFQNGVQKTAKAMKARSYPLEEIIAITGLDAGVIQDL